ncbi:MAG: hypothetical protein WAU70_03305 [Flavobacteriales bacterium]
MSTASSTAPPSLNLTEEGGPLDFSSFMDGFAADVKGYVAAEKRYIAMKATGKAGELMGKTFQVGVVFLTVAMAVLFLCIGLGFYLGELLHSNALGFVIVGGIYLLGLGIFQLWWNSNGRDNFILGRINELNNDDNGTQKP